MRSRRIVRTAAVLCGILAVSRLSGAQTGNPAANVSSVVRGGVVIVSFDLISSDQNAQFAVVLDVSSDGGKTYTVRPRTLKGDVGPAIRAGVGKQITWEAARDVENLEVDRYRYRVTATPVRAQSLTTPPAQSPARAVQQPAPPNGVSVPPPKGNGMKWAGIGLMGGGGALAVMSMTMMKEEYCDQFGCYYDETNSAMLWTGIAAAGGGAALLTIGASKNHSGAEIVVRKGALVVQHRMPLRRLMSAIR